MEMATIDSRQFDDGNMEATNAISKCLFGDGNETTYKTGDYDEHNFGEELQSCPNRKSPSKAKNVVIRSSKPSLKIALKSSSKTTMKSFGLNSEKVSFSISVTNLK